MRKIRFSEEQTIHILRSTGGATADACEDGNRFCKWQWTVGLVEILATAKADGANIENSIAIAE
jgi:hypothetical protein